MQEYTQTSRGFLDSIQEHRDSFVRAIQDLHRESDRRISNEYKTLQSERQSSAGMKREDVMKAIREEERKRKEQFVNGPIDIAELGTIMMPAIPKSLEPGTTDKMVAQVLTPQVDDQADIQEQEPIEEPDEESTQLRSVVRPKQKDIQETEEDEDLCYKISKSSLDTVPLVNNIIELYNRDHGKYPDAVIIEPLRYMALGIKHRLAFQC